MSGDMKTELSRVSARSTAEQQSASITVATWAENEQDCRLLLDMLGLLPAAGMPCCSECGKAQQHLRVTALTPLGACGRCHNRLRSKAASAERWPK